MNNNISTRSIVATGYVVIGIATLCTSIKPIASYIKEEMGGSRTTRLEKCVGITISTFGAVVTGLAWPIYWASYIMD
jgi:hypothetical protein